MNSVRFRHFALPALFLVILFGVNVSANTFKNGKIAFESARDGNSEIYVMNADGSGVRRLTFDAAADQCPSWAPNGKVLAFLRTEGGTSRIMLVNADGGFQRATTITAAECGIAWSPDGQRLSFASLGDIFNTRADGSDSRNLTNSPDRLDRSPAWSADGKTIAIIRTSTTNYFDLFSVDLQSSQIRQVSQVPAYTTVGAPDWSALTDQIVFARAHDVMDWSNLVTLIDGRTMIQGLSYDVTADVLETKWSPDTQSVLLEYYGTLGFWVLKRDTGIATQLLAEGSNPDWQPVPTTTESDFDGDGRADISVFREPEGNWYVNGSQVGFTGVQWGLATDELATGDYDGDGKADPAIFRDGAWWIKRSSGGYYVVNWGLPGDKPVPADYDGDGKTDVAIVRDGVWWINNSSGGYQVVQWGFGTDMPVPADYDGDGKADPAIFRNGEWWILKSTGGYSAFQWGLPTDKLVPADYDGDGKTDPAIFREGDWWILKSTGSYSVQNWGLPDDIPAPADYDGDGKADPTIFRGGVWWISKSTGGYQASQWGLPSDRAVPANEE